jgi:trans-aconitate 2-methyltransferase
MAAANPWDPRRYERFAYDRERPFWDLAALLQASFAPRLADLGCGTGRLTAALAARLGARAALGVDSSPAMLEQAAAHAGPRVRFERGDIASWEAPGAFDIVFSNAALHWVGDHPAVLGRWTAALAPGGQLAVQLPDNRRSPPHRLAAELAGEPIPHTVLDIDEYSRLLDNLGFAEQHVRAQAYPARLPSRAAAVEWLRGSGLTYYERRIEPARYAELVAALEEALPDERPFRLTYVRVLLWGRLPRAGAGAAGR